ncbi:hypothetical protein D3C71_1300420 [compost metagenome]
MLIDIATFLNLHYCTRELLKILATFNKLVRLIICRLYTNLKSKDARRRIIRQEIQNFWPHDICCDFKLEHTALMIIDQELKHFHRIVAVDIEGAVQEFNDFGTIFN